MEQESQCIQGTCAIGYLDVTVDFEQASIASLRTYVPNARIQGRLSVSFRSRHAFDQCINWRHPPHYLETCGQLFRLMYVYLVTLLREQNIVHSFTEFLYIIFSER